MSEQYTSLSQSVADTIRDRIFIEHQYRPGDRLPNERQLAEQLGVSRTSIREAVKLLVAGGVLRIERGSGTYVTDHPGMQEDPLGLGKLTATTRLMAHWYETRLILEPEIVRLTAERGTDAELKEIARLEEVSEAHSRVWAPDLVLRDRDFHTAIVNAAHNEVLSRIWAPLTDETVLSWHALMNQRPDMRQYALSTHKEIVKALSARDGFGAMLAMRRHLLTNLQFIQSAAEGEPAPPVSKE